MPLTLYTCKVANYVLNKWMTGKGSKRNCGATLLRVLQDNLVLSAKVKL